eukprot:4498792-Alexandrium_andersonii.AAC.1
MVVGKIIGVSLRRLTGGTTVVKRQDLGGSLPGESLSRLPQLPLQPLFSPPYSVLLRRPLYSVINVLQFCPSPVFRQGSPFPNDGQCLIGYPGPPGSHLPFSYGGPSRVQQEATKAVHPLVRHMLVRAHG